MDFLRSHPLWAILRKGNPYLFIVPGLVLLLFVFLYPVGYAFRLSFFDWKLETFQRGVPWVGLEQYIKAFSDERFWNSLKVTTFFTMASIILELVIAFPIALVLSQKFRGRGFLLSLYMLPFFTSDVVVGLTFRMMLNYEFGAINSALKAIGLNQVLWLSDLRIAFFSVLLVEIWQMTPFAVLFLSAGIQSLPTSPFEAAKIDGANQLQSFFFIMVPLLRPVLLVIILFRTIHLFKIFDIIFILTGGGPAGVTDVLSVYINRHAFSFFDMGYASAVSMIMVAILIIFSVLTNTSIRRQ